MSAIPDLRKSARRFEAVLEHARRAELTGAQPQDSRRHGAIGVDEQLRKRAWRLFRKQILALWTKHKPET